MNLSTISLTRCQNRFRLVLPVSTLLFIALLVGSCGGTREATLESRTTEAPTVRYRFRNLLTGSEIDLAQLDIEVTEATADQPAFVVIRSSMYEHREFVISAQPESVPTIYLRPLISLGGRVLDQVDGSGIAGVQVLLLDFEREAIPWLRSDCLPQLAAKARPLAETTEPGRFRSAEIPAVAQFGFILQKDGLMAGVWGPFRASEVPDEGFEFRVHFGETVDALVVNPKGQALAKSWCHLATTKTQLQGARLYSTSASAGPLSIPHSLLESASLRFGAEGHQAVTITDMIGDQKAQRIVLQASEIREGRVQEYGTGVPITGATIEVIGGSNGTSTIRSNAEGKFSFACEKDAQFANLVVEKSGYEQVYGKGFCFVKLPSYRLWEELVVYMAPRRQVQGRIFDQESGVPIEGARFRIVTEQDAWAKRPQFRSCRSDQNGRFVLRDAPSAPFILSVYHPRYLPPADRPIQLIEWRDDAPRPATIELPMVSCSRLSGRIVGTDDKLIQRDLSVSWHFSDDESYRQIPSNLGGVPSEFWNESYAQVVRNGDFSIERFPKSGGRLVVRDSSLPYRLVLDQLSPTIEAQTFRLPIDSGIDLRIRVPDELDEALIEFYFEAIKLDDDGIVIGAGHVYVELEGRAGETLSKRVHLPPGTFNLTWHFSVDGPFIGGEAALTVAPLTYSPQEL